MTNTYEIYTDACKMAFDAQLNYNHAHHDIRSIPSIKADLLLIANACNATAKRLGKIYTAEFRCR
jgi:hypothetical protein